MAKQPLVIVGAGGHATVVWEVINLLDRFAVVGCTDPRRDNGLTRLGVPYLGDDTVLPELLAGGVTSAALGVAGLDNRVRREIYQRLKAAGFTLPAMVHPAATVAARAVVGQGSVVMVGAIVNPGAVIGDNVVVNTGAVVEHDCLVEDGVQIGPGAILCGGVRVREGAFLGAGSCTIHGIVIGEYVIVGAGSVVTRDVPAGVTVAGNPARGLTSEGRENSDA